MGVEDNLGLHRHANSTAVTMEEFAQGGKSEEGEESAAVSAKAVHIRVVDKSFLLDRSAYTTIHDIEKG